MKYEKIYDISVLMGVENIDYPGTTPYTRELTQNIERGDDSNLSRLIMSTHSGTHLDAPSHFIPDGKHIDEYPVGFFILPARVVQIEDKSIIRSAELEKVKTAGYSW